MDEFSRIATFFKPLASGVHGSLGLADDAAVIACPPGEELVVTKDAIAEGVHYIGTEPPQLIAKKLLRCNLSDLAAMGAKPLYYLLAVMLPARLGDDWLKAFAEGLKEDQQKYGIDLIGGDSIGVKGEMAGFSLTAIGSVPKGKALRRSAAKLGDLVCVTGTLGDAALGLALAKEKLDISVDNEDRKYLEDRYFLPIPRLDMGVALRDIAPACTDISDGLVQDAGHIAKASGVSIRIEADKVPLSAAARRCVEALPALLERILTGGDDYELLFTCQPESLKTMQQASKQCGVPVTVIGRVEQGEGVRVISSEGKAMQFATEGWQHS